ncbi:MAG TPA: hypothetical protein VEZ44_14780 [bacterium]|nr:hypothetical protein [bacterium]
MSTTSPTRRGSIAGAIGWMFLISILLFWLPVVGPLIAGIVGGRKAGGVGAAILAVILPALCLGAVLLVFGTALTGIPLLGMLAGLGTAVLVLLHAGPLLLGAIIGGLTV